MVLAQAYAAKQAEQEKASSAPAAASSDTGPTREASTYAPPDWAGPPTGYHSLTRLLTSCMTCDSLHDHAVSRPLVWTSISTPHCHSLPDRSDCDVKRTFTRPPCSRMQWDL